MNQELKKLHANFEKLVSFVGLLPRAIEMPSYTLKIFFMPIFKKIYCDDITNLLSFIMEHDEEKSQKISSIRPTLEKKMADFEAHLQEQYKKTSLLVEKRMQKKKQLFFEVSIVLMAAYFEDFLKNFFIKQINKNPKRALPFLDKQLRISDLKEFGFNLSERMGSVISDKVNFQNLGDTEKAYSKSFRADIYKKDSTLRKRINHLFQMRHLIVHNGGIIDKKFCLSTQTKTSCVGKRIAISMNMILMLKEACLKVGSNICETI